MMQAYTVSVVMITYGHEKFIEQAIDGVIAQQFSGNIQLIIANDASPDATDAVVQHYLATKNIPTNITIEYTLQQKNIGMMPNFIWALKRATGTYIALCEGDDYWTAPTKLQQQVDFLDTHPDYIMCCHDRNVVNEHNEIIIHNQQTTKQDKDTFVQTLVYRNVAFDDTFYTYFEKAKNGDTFLIYRLHQLGKTHYFDFNGACYRVSDVGVWSQVSAAKRFDMSMDSYDNMIAYYQVLQNPTAIKELQKWKAEQYLIKSQDLFQHGDKTGARKALWQYNKALWQHNPSLLWQLNTIKSNIALALKYW